MGIFSVCFKSITLEVGETYFISNGEKIKEVVFKKSSNRGFGFFNVITGKKFGRGHMYPLENIRTEKRLTFWVSKHLTITKKEQQHGNDDIS